MVSLLKLVAVAAAALPAAAGTPAGPVVESDVYGGQKAPPGAFPYVVSLALRYWGGYYQACGGVLLNARTVITAAHCSNDTAPSDWKIRAGSSAWDTGGVVVSATRFLVNRNYSYVKGQSDIALWELSEPVYESTTISYVTLPPPCPDDPTVGTDVIITGWGATNFTLDDSPKYLREAKLRVLDAQVCQDKANGGGMFMDGTMICVGTGTKVGNRPSACIGDSGSPMVGAESGIFWGIMNLFSGDCGEPGHIDVSIRVTKFVDWINKNKF